jgi:RNA polymerase sigma factor (sigma-70 family)
MLNGAQLLQDYAKTGSEAAFSELVKGYVDLVYSSAVRLVNGDTHLAQDITQTVFADLARTARALSPKVMLGGWLHRHTCFVASKVRRGERRRQLREQQAVEMNLNEDNAAEELALIAPILDEAINELGGEDRQAVLLRYFEQRDFRSVGEALGSNEEAARKRVNRALDKLQLLLKRRGVVLSVAGLATALGSQVVTAAPAGIAATVITTALAGTAATGGPIIGFVEFMSMTKLKAGVAAAVLAAIVTVPLVLEHRAQLKLREENAALRQEVAKAGELTAENQRLSKLLAATEPALPRSNDPSPEVLKLRGEVGRLRQEKVTDAANKTNGPSLLSGLSSNPEMLKLIRNQQKMGMTVIYKDFAKQANLPKETSEKLTELLADDVMANIDHITTMLSEGKSSAEREKVFAEQEAALQVKVQDLIGPEAFAKYQDYTHNLASYLTAEQFKQTLEGEKETKDQRAKQLYDVLKEETQVALGNAGLNPDFQTVPSMNFRNFVSEQEAEKNLKLLDDIYQRAATRAGAFLSPEEIKKFAEFRSNAINANRMALALNRKMMAPGSK